jgi:ABC-2 type transport system ATP-binding protein
MSTLLRTLHVETFILNLRDPLEALPPISGYTLQLIDPMTLSVEINKQASINQLFTELNHHNIQVLSMRNKSNRLEELFVRLVGEGSA